MTRTAAYLYFCTKSGLAVVLLIFRTQTLNVQEPNGESRRLKWDFPLNVKPSHNSLHRRHDHHGTMTSSSGSGVNCLVVVVGWGGGVDSSFMLRRGQDPRNYLLYRSHAVGYIKYRRHAYEPGQVIWCHQLTLTCAEITKKHLTTIV